MASSFDTLAAARELVAAGIEPAHAEAIAATMRRAAGAEHGHLATKADVAELRPGRGGPPNGPDGRVILARAGGMGRPPVPAAPRPLSRVRLPSRDSPSR